MSNSKFIQLSEYTDFPKSEDTRKKLLQDILESKPISTNVRVDGLSGEFDVYEVPIENLIYNFRNYRFYAERLTYESQNGKSYFSDDSNRKIAARNTENLIWNIDEKRNDETINSLLKYGQKHPGVCDLRGILSSGNTRLMLLHQIMRRREAGDFKNINPSRLDELTKMRVVIEMMEYSTEELESKETSIQHHQDNKLDYDPINKYFIILFYKKD